MHVDDIWSTGADEVSRGKNEDWMEKMVQIETWGSVIFSEWVEEDKPAYRRQRRSGQTSKQKTNKQKKQESIVS